MLLMRRRQGWKKKTRCRLLLVLVCVACVLCVYVSLRGRVINDDEVLLCVCSLPMPSFLHFLHDRKRQADSQHKADLNEKGLLLLLCVLLYYKMRVVCERAAATPQAWAGEASVYANGKGQRAKDKGTNACKHGQAHKLSQQHTRFLQPPLVINERTTTTQQGMNAASMCRERAPERQRERLL